MNTENDDLTIAYMAGAGSRNAEIRKLKQERDQLKEENQLMKSYLIELVRWNSHGYVGAKKLLDKINQITQENNQ